MSNNSLQPATCFLTGEKLFHMSVRGSTTSKKLREKIIQSVPDLKKGINNLKKPEEVPGFQALTAGEIAGKQASAVWIDARNESSTYALSSMAGPRLLDKVHIGRAFTPFQHNQLVSHLNEFIMADTELLIIPNITLLYETGQTSDWESRELFEHSVSKIREVQEEHNLKVLTSVTGGELKLRHKIEALTDQEVRIDLTSQGVKYSGNGYQQMSYSEDGVLQTTIPLYCEEKAIDRKIEEVI